MQGGPCLCSGNLPENPLCVSVNACPEMPYCSVVQVFARAGASEEEIKSIIEFQVQTGQAIQHLVYVLAMYSRHTSK